MLYLLLLKRLADFVVALFLDGTAIALSLGVERKERLPRIIHITGNNKHDSSVENCLNVRICLIVV
jgi:hypothetical protein